MEYVILPKVCNYIFSDLWHRAGGAALGLSCVAGSEALAFASASAAAPYYANAIRCIVSASQLVTLQIAPHYPSKRFSASVLWEQ